MGIKAVLWDMDGVLIDSEPGYNVAVGDMVRGLGMPFGEREIALITGASYKNIAEILGIERDIGKLYAGTLMKGLLKTVNGMIDGAEDFLRRFRALGIPMAIGSSSPREVVDFAAKNFGMGQYMTAVVTGTDAENGKPAPDIYLLCADKLGVRPEECLVVEDSMNGLKAGLNAGMVCAAFTGTARHGFDLSGAHLTIERYDEGNWKKIEGLL
ncbi:phosphatase [Clostridia bacterium]|nr:phosphatase [Clostridia bacterium]